VDGVLVIDKPEGLTSHDVVAVARRCLHERRVGHTGTLDPMATGVLPLACGRATRLVRFLTASEKEYEATIRFGLTTDSYDVTGLEVSRSDLRPTPAQIEAALGSLRGDYLQLPPAFSAKKVAGQRAYSLARKQQVVTLAAVPVHVPEARLLEVADETATVVLRCSAGFYVRSFAHRLGELAGSGACLEKLRRTRSGEFDLRNAVTIQTLHDDAAGTLSRMIPLERLLSDMQCARVGEEGRDRAAHGRAIEPQHLLTAAGTAPSSDGFVRLLDESGHLIAIAEHVNSGALHPCVVLI
jgi:tRNA pseudouridine55 synthase